MDWSQRDTNYGEKGKKRLPLGRARETAFFQFDSLLSFLPTSPFSLFSDQRCRRRRWPPSPQPNPPLSGYLPGTITVYDSTQFPCRCKLFYSIISSFELLTIRDDFDRKDGAKTTTPAELKIEAVPVPQQKTGSDKLRFDRLQPAEDELLYRHKREFGRFVAREAQIDEEYWTAAWLRAESHWEDKQTMRHADSFKRQFAEREFIALKRRCNSQLADKSTCIIAMKRKEPNVKQTVLSSIVGTLDLSIRYRICTGVFPEETVNSPVFSSTYNADHSKFGYVANLCVSKYARRQGIASNMLQLAVETAKSFGVDQVLVHVRKDNTGARKLYGNLGFQMVEVAPSQSPNEQIYLLSLRT